MKLWDIERLRAVADGPGRARVHFNNGSVGTDGDACASHCQ
ncbi:MAG: hypothetical protein NTV52_22535 [Acidobacteria bacterium]|nr:hypothetical protein [Acidobacteriota bacterium]